MKLEDAISNPKFNSEVHKATINILFTAHWLRTQINANLKPYGLTQEQYNIMRILKGKHPEKMCVKDIAQRMIERSSNVPRILDRLVRKNLIERKQSKQDRRETESVLTQKGLELLQKVNENVKENENKLMNLNEAAAAQLNALLENLRDV